MSSARFGRATGTALLRKLKSIGNWGSWVVAMGEVDSDEDGLSGVFSLDLGIAGKRLVRFFSSRL